MLNGDLPDVATPKALVPNKITGVKACCGLKGSLGIKAGKVPWAVAVTNTVKPLGAALAAELKQGWPLQLREEPLANVDRYDDLRSPMPTTPTSEVNP